MFYLNFNFFGDDSVSIFLLYIITPIKCIMSEISIVFILLSKGELLDNDGEVFTYKSQGFRLLSRRTSNP